MKRSKRINEIILFTKLANYLASLSLCSHNNSRKIDNVTQINIECINDCINNKKIVADIACDHGYIGYCVLENKLADKVIFSDISAKSLEKASKLMQNQDKFANFEFLIGDGLNVLYTEVFASIIAGVGGREIVKILSNKEKIKLSQFFILQTSQDDTFLRGMLSSLGLHILCDKMVLDGGHIYHTFLVGHEIIDDIDVICFDFFTSCGLINKYALTHEDFDVYKQFNCKYYGKNNLLISSSDHKIMLNWEIDRLTKILSGLEDNSKYNEETGSKTKNQYKAMIKEKLRVLDKMRI